MKLDGFICHFVGSPSPEIIMSPVDNFKEALGQVPLTSEALGQVPLTSWAKLFAGLVRCCCFFPLLCILLC